MVLIVSEDKDLSTRFVIDWLYFSKKKFVRVNDSDKLTLINFEISDSGFDFYISVNGASNFSFKASEIKSYWHRRGHFTLDSSQIIQIDSLSKGINRGINYYLNIERNYLENALHKYLESHVSIKIDGVNSLINRKLEYLLVAKNAGLLIPATSIVSTKAEVLSFFNENGEILVSKGINETIKFLTNDLTQVVSPSVTISREDVENLPDTFFPSLIQKKISKKFDVRIFYVNGKVYPAAIFSPIKYRDEIDYRVIEREEELATRLVPFNLEVTFIDKLNIFMKKIGRNTGSFDFLYTHENELVFLEVNPVGQFGFVSDLCNYYIEKEIANQL